VTPVEAAWAMRALLERNQNGDDEEQTHHEGDRLMCTVLTDLGYGEMVEAFRAMTRWYS